MIGGVSRRHSDARTKNMSGKCSENETTRLGR
jgi:hypothetical protein